MKLTPEQSEFIKSEFDISMNDSHDVDADKWHEIRMSCFDIEGNEAVKGFKQSDRVNIAASIADIKYSRG